MIQTANSVMSCVQKKGILLNILQLITVCIFGPFLFLFYRLYVNWRFMRGIEAQFLALQKGFTELIPQHLLKPFDHKELEVHIMSVNNTPVIIINC